MTRRSYCMVRVSVQNSSISLYIQSNLHSISPVGAESYAFDYSAA